MKKYFLFLAIPFTVFADTCHLEQVGGGDWRIVCEGSGIVLNYVDVTNKIFIIENCESLKATLLDVVDNNHRLAQEALSQIHTTQGLVGQLQPHLSSTPSATSAINAVYDSLEEVEGRVGYVESTMAPFEGDNSDSIYSLVNGINCGSCPTNGASGSGSGGCCDVDFTDIIDRLIIAERQRAAITNQISRISNYLGVVTNQLAYNNFLLEHGFFGITNALFVGSRSDDSQVGEFYMRSSYGTSRPSRWATYYLEEPASITDVLYVLDDNLSVALASLNNYKYHFMYNSFPVLTNTISAIHRDTTNFFSFFRGEIGVQGVLSDWQSEQVSGSYHDFLTNHYLTVVLGGPLSGNQSTKTNWFSRIETLLAALVFTDSAETNTVDASAGDTERQQLATSYGTANQAAAAFSEDFKTTSQSIVTLYQNYFTTFENASMPSHVVLMRLSNPDLSEDVEIAFQSDSLGILVESCRLVTTLCWSSVGIFLLYKFLVWSARCVIVACQFIYRAISSVFRS